MKEFTFYTAILICALALIFYIYKFSMSLQYNISLEQMTKVTIKELVKKECLK